MNETEDIKQYIRQILKIVDEAYKIMFMRKTVVEN